MQSRFPNDDSIKSTLRNVTVPEPPADLVSRMRKRRPKVDFSKLILTAAVASLAGVLIIAGTMHATPSLGQVADRQAKQTHYTVIQTRFLGEGRKIRIVSYRDGFTRKVEDPSGTTFDDGTRAVTVRRTNSGFDVDIDDSKPLPTADQFSIGRLLRYGGKMGIQRGIHWNGIKVDRFWSHDTYRDQGKMQTYDQLLIVDAGSSLPLRMEVFRDNRSWGDTYDFNYGKPPASAMAFEIPKGAVVHDIREERTALKAQLKTGAVLVDSIGGVSVLLPLTPGLEGPTVPVSFDTIPEKFIAVVEAGHKLGKPKPRKLTINDRDWEVAWINGLPKQRFTPDARFGGKTIGCKVGKLNLVDLPIVHVEFRDLILEPFAKSSQTAR